jgi:hypothetical protein
MILGRTSTKAGKLNPVARPTLAVERLAGGVKLLGCEYIAMV